MLVDADGFPFFVVDEVEFRDFDDDGFAVTQFVGCFDTASDDLFRWDTVGLFGEHAHEVDAAA